MTSKPPLSVLTETDGRIHLASGRIHLARWGVRLDPVDAQQLATDILAAVGSPMTELVSSGLDLPTFTAELASTPALDVDQRLRVEALHAATHWRLGADCDAHDVVVTAGYFEAYLRGTL